MPRGPRQEKEQNAAMIPPDTRIAARLETTALHRRDVLLGGSLALVSTGSMPARSASPHFSTNGAQFVELDPREAVSDMRLKGLNGRNSMLGSFRGQAVLLAFWASWCPPCRRELPILHRLQAKSRELGFAVLPVSLDRDAATARRFIERLGLNGLSSFIDTTGDVASGPQSRMQTPFQLYGMPVSYIIDAEGRSAGYLVGEADWSAPEAIRLLRSFAA